MRVKVQGVPPLPYNPHPAAKGEEGGGEGGRGEEGGGEMSASPAMVPAHSALFQGLGFGF